MKTDKLSILRICENCNREYELMTIDLNDIPHHSIVNITKCPHCQKRDDPWIIVTPKREG